MTTLSSTDTPSGRISSLLLDFRVGCHTLHFPNTSTLPYTTHTPSHKHTHRATLPKHTPSHTNTNTQPHWASFLRRAAGSGHLTQFQRQHKTYSLSHIRFMHTTEGIPGQARKGWLPEAITNLRHNQSLMKRHHNIYIPRVLLSVTHETLSRFRIYESLVTLAGCDYFQALEFIPKASTQETKHKKNVLQKSYDKVTMLI